MSVSQIQNFISERIGLGNDSEIGKIEDEGSINWFHGQDPLKEERSRIERTGRVDFPEEWEGESQFGEGEKALIEQKIQEVEEYLSETDYYLPDHRENDLEIQHKERGVSEHCGRYDDRSELAVPLHLINPDFDNFESQILSVILHEHGHDVYGELLQDTVDTNNLFAKTLNEFVAELTLHQFAPNGYSRDYKIDPFDERYSMAFEGLPKAFDPSLRQEELSLTEEIEEELGEETDYEKIGVLAEELNSISPETGDFRYGANSDAGMRTNMFLQNFVISEQGDTVQDIIEAKRSVKKMIDYRKWQEDPTLMGNGLLGDWNDNNFGPSSGINSSKRWGRQIGRGIEEYLLRTSEEYREIAQEMAEIEEESSVEVMSKGYGWKNSWDWGGPGGERWFELNAERNSIGADLITENKKDISEYMIKRNLESLQRMTEDYEEAIEGLEFEPEHKSQYLIDNVAGSGVTYGYDEDDWDEYFDFPHKVGCGLAHRLYEEEDVELRDVIEDPDEYLDRCKEEIYDVMETRVRRPEGLPEAANPYAIAS